MPRQAEPLRVRTPFAMEHNVGAGDRNCDIAVNASADVGVVNLKNRRIFHETANRSDACEHALSRRV